MNLKELIYLDYMATTPIDDAVFQAMVPYYRFIQLSGNPASFTHQYGQYAREAVKKASQQVSELIGAEEDEIVWTSGATEANNLALKGAAIFYSRKGNHIITSAIEHKSVLDPLKELESQGFEITLIHPNSEGLINPERVKTELRDETILVSIMHVNNEIGVIQDIKKIGELAREKGAIFHVDAAQSAGKIKIDVQEMGIDLMSLSAHKVYGPKGIGALFVRKKPKVRLKALIHGGTQQNNLRAGTLPTPLIVGMGEAFHIAKVKLNDDYTHAEKLKNVLWSKLKDLSGISLNGNINQRVPHNLNFCVDGVDGEALLCAIREVAVSTASACMTATREGSYVLRAIGIRDHLAQSSLRISFGRSTTQAEVERVGEILIKQIKRLRQMAFGENKGIN